jgi:hypothetical protein
MIISRPPAAIQYSYWFTPDRGRIIGVTRLEPTGVRKIFSSLPRGGVRLIVLWQGGVSTLDETPPTPPDGRKSRNPTPFSNLLNTYKLDPGDCKNHYFSSISPFYAF